MALSERYSTILDKCIGSLTTWKNFINANLEGPDKDTEITKMQVIAQEYCIIDENHKRSENAIQLVEQQVTDTSKNYNINAIFDENVIQQPVEDPTSNEIWEHLFNGNISVQEIKPKKKKENIQYEEVDDSLLCSNSFSAPVDPISKTVIRKPIRNKKCKHVYDIRSIYDYIRQSKRKARCPYMGCNNNQLAVSDLQVDDQLEEKITQYLATQETDEDSPDDSP